MIAGTFRIQDRRISVIGRILQLVICNSPCDRQAAERPPGIVNIEGLAIQGGVKILRRRGHHKKSRRKCGLVVETIAGMKLARLKTGAENQCVAVRFPDLADLARVGGKCVVIAKVERQKEGAGELPSRILQENKRPADIREPGRRVESGGVLFAIKIIEEDLVREPAD